MQDIITKENSVHFVLKKVWFDKIKAGEKTHEYRLYKPSWISKLIEKDTGMIKPKKYARFALGMTSDPAKNMVFEIKGITIKPARKTDLAIMLPELKESTAPVFDVELGKRIK